MAYLKKVYSDPTFDTKYGMWEQEITTVDETGKVWGSKESVASVSKDLLPSEIGRAVDRVIANMARDIVNAYDSVKSVITKPKKELNRAGLGEGFSEAFKGLAFTKNNWGMLTLVPAEMAFRAVVRLQREGIQVPNNIDHLALQEYILAGVPKHLAGWPGVMNQNVDNIVQTVKTYYVSGGTNANLPLDKLSPDTPNGLAIDNLSKGVWNDWAMDVKPSGFVDKLRAPTVIPPTPAADSSPFRAAANLPDRFAHALNTGSQAKGSLLGDWLKVHEGAFSELQKRVGPQATLYAASDRRAPARLIAHQAHGEMGHASRRPERKARDIKTDHRYSKLIAALAEAVFLRGDAGARRALDAHSVSP